MPLPRTERELAWEMLERMPSRLAAVEQHALAIHLASDEFREAIELVLSVLVRRRIETPADLRDPLRRWVSAYKDDRRHVELGDLVGQLKWSPRPLGGGTLRA